MFQERPGSIFGQILGAKWGPKGSQNASKIDLKICEFWNSFFNEIWLRKWSKNGAQKLPKMKPKFIKNSSKILLIFACFLEAPAEVRTLDLIDRGMTFMGSSLFDQDSKNH